jgi:hypothetical protein
MELDSVRGDLEAIESLEREIADLTAALRGLLPSQHFRLVWALRDSEERRGLAERLLYERRLADGLARHLPLSQPAAREAVQHVLEDHTLGAD